MNDVKVLANAIRLELLTELRTARSPTARRGAVPDDPDGAAATKVQMKAQLVSGATCRP